MPNLAIRRDYPRTIREIENLWIPMPDGVRLAARIWLPQDAEADPVPAILEYLPYRKRDGTAERDHLTHPYFAGHGYAGVRVDMRGSGDSEGVCAGEYLKQEQDDAIAVIEWLAAQKWCTGAVGMMGISWGGFNGLQVAARKPPALKAIISLCSTDDRYASDIHFQGGCILTDKLWWGTYAHSIVQTPPDPAIVGENWQSIWQERLKGNGLWVLDWFRHQRRDGFYKQGSICEDYAAVDVPVYAIGGWADGYTNSVFRLVENLPKAKGLIGPWAHKYPHFAEPGPRIGFCQEALRWWDQHLKCIETGIMDEPKLRAWVQEPMPPATHYPERPGRWVAEEGWRGASVEAQTCALVPGGLVPAAALAPEKEQEHQTLTIASPQNTGRAAPSWCAFGIVPDLAPDQRIEAGGATVFDSAPLNSDMDLLGFAQVQIEATSDQPNALLAGTLSAVAPDGSALLICHGTLNLTHRESHAAPEPLPIGAPFEACLRLNACGQRIPAGYRLRLALSNAYWPMVFPSPRRSQLELNLARCALVLPSRAPKPIDADLSPFGPPEGAAPLEVGPGAEHDYRREVTTDLTTGVQRYRRKSSATDVTHLHTGLTLDTESEEVFSIHPDDPATARGDCTFRRRFRRGDWSAEVRVAVSVAALEAVWRITAECVAEANGTCIHTQQWQEDIPRDLV